MKKDELIDNWLTNETSVSEKQELEKLIAFTEQLSIPSNTPKEAAWDSLLGKIESQTQAKQRILIPETANKYSWLLWVSGYAAALIMIGLLLFNRYDNVEWNVLVAELGKTELLELPDASDITINSSTEVRYFLDNWEDERIIKLYGEAFFEVTKGTAFTVETANGTVTVLGTSFNVYSREDQFSVTCKTGMVIVESNNQQITLTAGQMATLYKGELRMTDYPLGKIAAWRFGEFYFNASALTTVLEELERQFKIEIVVEADISERFYSGFFSKMNLNEALQLVCVPMGLKFEIKDDEVTIR
ncbi:MAG: ferric-dicitrate binding protein FerR (iron transport regulator) [Roseivirga sp.]